MVAAAIPVTSSEAFASGPGVGITERTDTLPTLNGVDLSLASSCIPVELLARIIGQISQIDRVLFGMQSHLDLASAIPSRTESADFPGHCGHSSSINSTVNFAECAVTQSAAFA
jgi:hypothetical protein